MALKSKTALSCWIESSNHHQTVLESRRCIFSCLPSAILTFRGVVARSRKWHLNNRITKPFSATAMNFRPTYLTCPSYPVSNIILRSMIYRLNSSPCAKCGHHCNESAHPSSTHKRTGMRKTYLLQLPKYSNLNANWQSFSLHEIKDSL